MLPLDYLVYGDLERAEPIGDDHVHGQCSSTVGTFAEDHSVPVAAGSGRTEHRNAQGDGCYPDQVHLLAYGLQAQS